MTVLQPKFLKQRASAILSCTQNQYRRIVTIHTTISLGATFVLFLIDLLLGNISAETSGLDHIGLWAVIETVRSLLNMGLSLALPFWQMGILYTSILMTRNQAPAFSQLARGFHRFGPILRYYLLMLAIATGVSIASSYVAMPFALFLGTPPELEQFLTSLDEAVLENPEQILAMLPMEQMLSYLLSLVIPMMLVFIVVMVHLSYRFRTSTYLLVDDPKVGALASLASSNRMTKGHKWSLWKLDLSFWWYYLLQGLVSTISLLPLIIFPLNTIAGNLICQAVSALGSLALVWWQGAYVELTYACAYDQLCTPPQQIITI